MPQTPRNQVGQPPTKKSGETEERLRQKKRAMRGVADRSRTDDQIDAVRSKGG